MKAKFLNYILISCLSLVFFSCENDEVLPPQSQADFTATSVKVKIGEVIQFANKSQNGTAYTWSFGDGTTSKEVSPKKSYQSSNVFLVSLVSTGAGGTTISNMEITVTPASNFTVVDEENLSAKIPVKFTNTSLGATTYSWSFGDANNSTSTEESPTFIYPTEGTFTVSLTTSTVYGSNTFTKEVVIGMAPETPADLYYIDYTDDFIRKLTLDDSGTITDVLNVVGKAGSGMAYDATNKKIYFTDFDTTPFGNIWRVNPDGSGLEALVANITDPYSIALDVAGNKMYWVDDAGNVSRANLNGSSPEIGILNVPAASWRGLALDLKNRKMYAYDAEEENLYIANLDGSNATIIISEIYGYAVAVDTVNSKVYFEDQRVLKRANLDGSNIETVDAKSTRIYGIEIDNKENKLYWGGRDSGELNRSNLDGSNKEILKSGLGSVRGIALIK